MAVFSGTSGKDIYTGTRSADTINGKADNDRLSGQGGSDLIRGGAGDDTLSGGDGNDFLLGDSGQDFISGGRGDDYADGGIGNDYLQDLDGGNQLRGGAGSDRLVTSHLSDVSGGFDNDTMVVKPTGLIETPGNGHFSGGSGFNTLGVSVEDAAMPGADGGGTVGNPYGFVKVTGHGSNGFSGEVTLQTDIQNDDADAEIALIDFDKVLLFNALGDSPLHYEGRQGTEGPSGHTATVRAGAGDDLFETGHDDEIIWTGGGKDQIVVTGFGADPETGVIDYGWKELPDFDADQDVLLLGYSDQEGANSRVEVEENGSQTLVTSFVTGDDGVEQLVSEVLIDTVGIQIVYDFTPV
jgi:hypothetical protein